MAIIEHTVAIASGPDDADFYNGAFNNTRNYVNIGSHANASLGPWAGFRFQTPSGLDPQSIVGVKLRLFNANLVRSRAFIRVRQSPQNSAWDDSTNNPRDIWQGLSSIDQVEVDVTPSTVATPYEFDISDQALPAISNMTFGVDYVGILLGPSDSTTLFGQWISYENTNPNKAELIFQVEIDPIDAEVETNPIVVDFFTGDTSAVAYDEINNVSYHDGINESTRRSLNVFTPSSVHPPPGGYPVVMFIHGGGWNGGGRNDVLGHPRILNDVINAGYALVSIDYKLTEANVILNTNIGYTHADIMEDIMASLQFIRTKGMGFGLDPEKIVLIGYSAGGHSALEAALLTLEDDPDAFQATYTGNSSISRRYEEYPDIKIVNGRSIFPHVAGVMMIGGPVKFEPLVANIFLNMAVNLYLGGHPTGGSVISLVNGECDLTKLISGDSNSIYANRTLDNIPFSIGAIYSDTDEAVPMSALWDPLYNTLSDFGYDVSQSSNQNVAQGVALSRYGYTSSGNNGGHDGLMYTYPSEFMVEWIKEAFKSSRISGASDHFII